MSYDTKVRLLQGGDVLEVASGGTVNVLAGGSIQSAGGASYGGVSATGSVTGAEIAATGTLTGAFLALGGTTGRWAFGTATMTAGGSVIVNTGLTTVHSAVSNAVAARAAVNGAAGTYFVQVDATRFANGSIMLLSVANGTVTPGGGTVAWSAFGL